MCVILRWHVGICKKDKTLYMWTPIWTPMDGEVDPVVNSGLRIYHHPLNEGQFHIGTPEILNYYGTYKSLHLAKIIARGIIRHNLKWNERKVIQLKTNLELMEEQAE